MNPHTGTMSIDKEFTKKFIVQQDNSISIELYSVFGNTWMMCEARS